MSVRTFRLKVLKCLKTPQQKPGEIIVHLWLKMRDGTSAIMAPEHDKHDLCWWGLENGSDVYVHFKMKN